MIVSHRHRFIFLKTIKTASSSMEIALSKVLGPDDIITPTRADLDEQRGTIGHGQNFRLDHPDVPKAKLWRRLLNRPERYYHPTVGYYEHMPAWRIRRYVGEDVWKSYYKIAFERNPWDRQVSFYHYKTRNNQKPVSFDDFLKKGHKARIGNWSIYSIDDKVEADFLGRYENVGEDFAKALAAIGLSSEISLPRANTTPGKPKRSYRDYYTPKTKDLVADWYNAEIELFGYQF